MAKRFTKYQRIVKLLEAKLADPEFLVAEERKRQALRVVEEYYAARNAEINAELRRKHDKQVDELHSAAAAKIDAIYTAESTKCRQAHESRDWLSKVGDAIFNVLPTEFRYSLSRSGWAPRLADGSLQFLIRDETAKNYGRYVPSRETNELVRRIEQEYVANLKAINEQAGTESRPRMPDLRPFRPFKTGGFFVTDIDKARALLAQVELELEQLGVSEAQVRRHYGFDDTTIAQAAAYAGLTRKLADKIRPALFSQLQQSHLCPYCGQDLGETPHADHIFPVSIGGLSTPENMVLVCENCNLQKHALTLNEFVVRFGRDRTMIEANLLRLKKRF